MKWMKLSFESSQFSQEECKLNVERQNERRTVNSEQWTANSEQRTGDKGQRIAWEIRIMHCFGCDEGGDERETKWKCLWENDQTGKG